MVIFAIIHTNKIWQDLTRSYHKYWQDHPSLLKLVVYQDLIKKIDKDLASFLHKILQVSVWSIWGN